MLPGRRRLIFGLIIVVAAIFRLARIGHESLWFDEILTTKSAAAPFLQCVEVVRSVENAPPLYYLIVNRWVRLFGDSDVSLRLPSALAGIVSVVVIGRLGRALFADRVPSAGLWAAAMLAVQPYHIAYSMDARPYALSFLLAAWSCEAMVLLLARASPWAQLGYVLASSAMLWTHTMSGFVLIAQNLVLVPLFIARDWGQSPFRTSEHLNLRRWLILQGAVLTLMIPWIGPMRSVWAAGAPWIGPTTVVQVVRNHAATTFLLVLWVIGAIIAVIKGWRRCTFAIVFALALWIVPIAFPQVLSMLHKPILIPRYAITSLLGIHLLCGYAAAATCRIGTIVGVAIIVAGLMISGPLLWRGHTLLQTDKRDVRSPATLVSASAQSGDVVRVPEFVDASFDHYFKRTDVIRITSLPAVQTVQPRPQRFWILTTGTEVPPAVEGYTQRGEWTYDGAHLELLERNP
jgi:mannosyltransferase